ncbi:hypothetical protein [Candidatus Phycosocius spiralis]|nr:hypothetical protein [Candidatus Phycosocius spiralis]
MIKKLNRAFVFALALTSVLAGCISIDVNEAEVKAEIAPTPSSLIGSWDVSLFSQANSEPSKTQFVVSEVTAGTFKGTFYGSEIQNGRYIVKGNDLIFAGRTSDQSGTYWHSGRIRNNSLIQGQTLSDGRNFLMAWSAKRN